MLTFNNKIITRNDKWVSHTYIPPIRTRTLRLLFKPGTEPYIGYRTTRGGNRVMVGHKGTFTQISNTPNMWDWTYDNTNWLGCLDYQYDLLQVLGGDSTNVTNMAWLFSNCTSLTDVCFLDTSKVTNMSYMFEYCSNLFSIATFDTSNVTDMSSMFFNAGQPSTQAGLLVIPSFNTSKVTNMSFMFSGTRASVYPNFDTSNVTNMYNMFNSNYTVINAPMYNTSKVTEARSMFAEAQELQTVPLYDFSRLTNMNSMFRNCFDLQSIPAFDITNVTSMNLTFAGCESCNSGQYDLYYTATHKAIEVTEHHATFYDCGVNSTTGTQELRQIASDWKTI